jgi:Lrp/AsnC family leucine-responsive transcriptional regulator
MVGVVLDCSTPESIAAFEQSVGAMKEVLDCPLAAVDFDYFFSEGPGAGHGRVQSAARQLITLPSARQIRTFLMSKKVKDHALLSF